MTQSYGPLKQYILASPLGRRLSCRGWLSYIPRWKTVTHPSRYQPTDSAADEWSIKLTTIESQVRRPQSLLDYRATVKDHFA